MRQRSMKARARRREEGAVMLIVMLILLTATALAGVTLQATEYELRAAGFNRSAIQTHYVSEAAMTTTLAWVDATSLGQDLERHIDAWNDVDPPNVTVFGEPELGAANRRDTSRTQWSQQARLAAVTMPPITVAGEAGDAIGSFGPRVSYKPGTQDPDELDPLVSDYVVDMYDCEWLTGVGSPGSRVNRGGSSTTREEQLYCVITSRGRSYLWGGATKTWKSASTDPIELNRYTLAHDSRGTLVSPPVVRRRR